VARLFEFEEGGDGGRMNLRFRPLGVLFGSRFDTSTRAAHFVEVGSRCIEEPSDLPGFSLEKWSECFTSN